MFVPRLDFKVTHQCNLNCEGCAYLSVAGLKGDVSLAEFHNQLAGWSSRIHPGTWSLLGGEPTLNRDLYGFFEISRYHWPSCDMEFVTNGTLLSHFPDLPRLLAEHNFKLCISIHGKGESYQRRVEVARGVVEGWVGKNPGLKVQWRRPNRSWHRLYRGTGGDIRPIGRGNADRVWERCHVKVCMQLHEGKLWKCPRLPYIKVLNDQMGLTHEEEWKPMLDYRPLDPDCTDEELREFLSRKAEGACAICCIEDER